MGEDSLEPMNSKLVPAGDSWSRVSMGHGPGSSCPATPSRAPSTGRSTSLAGEALDQARVVRLDASASVPAGAFKPVLATVEFSPLEPQFERKDYAAGVGEVEEKVVAGGHERFDLVSVTK
jgi:hypothetical protein